MLNVRDVKLAEVVFDVDFGTHLDWPKLRIVLKILKEINRRGASDSRFDHILGAPRAKAVKKPFHR